MNRKELKIKIENFFKAGGKIKKLPPEKDIETGRRVKPQPFP